MQLSVLEISTKMFPEIQDFSVINYWKINKSRLLADGRSSYNSSAEVSEDFSRFFLSLWQQVAIIIFCG